MTPVAAERPRTPDVWTMKIPSKQNRPSLHYCISPWGETNLKRHLGNPITTKKCYSFLGAAPLFISLRQSSSASSYVQMCVLDRRRLESKWQSERTVQWSFRCPLRKNVRRVLAAQGPSRRARSLNFCPQLQSSSTSTSSLLRKIVINYEIRKLNPSSVRVHSEAANDKGAHAHEGTSCDRALWRNPLEVQCSLFNFKVHRRRCCRCC